MDDAWERPGPAAAELIREAAQLFLDQPAGLADQVDAAIVAAAPPGLREDPTLASEVAASNRANLFHWATCNVRDPGGRVPVNLSPAVLAIARDAVRRGLDQNILTTYRTGQNIAWRYVMQVAFALSSEPEVLHETLDCTARSIFTFVDDMLEAIGEQVEAERAALTRGTHAERFEVVTSIIEGAPMSPRRASERLGYEVARRHAAAVVWSDPGAAGHAELARAGDLVARAAAGAPRPLAVAASGSSLWLWFACASEPDVDAARRAVEGLPDVRVALGPVGEGLAGFRRSHLDAVATQRLMVRMPADVRLASFDELALVALAAHDEERAAEFAARTLGDLASADPELLHTLRVYVREGFSASRAARALYAHRNTVLGRLHRAEELLPAPLERRRLEVGLALEIVRWLR